MLKAWLPLPVLWLVVRAPGCFLDRHKDSCAQLWTCVMLSWHCTAEEVTQESASDFLPSLSGGTLFHGF